MRLIDADALYDRVEESRRDNPHRDPKVMVNHINEHGHFLDMIIEAPTIDAEPVRHGRWIQSKTVPSYHSCSYCKMAHNMPKSCNVYVLPYYCMDCGTKMDLEVSDEKQG